MTPVFIEPAIVSSPSAFNHWPAVFIGLAIFGLLFRGRRRVKIDLKTSRWGRVYVLQDTRNSRLVKVVSERGTEWFVVNPSQAIRAVNKAARNVRREGKRRRLWSREADEDATETDRSGSTRALFMVRS